jgi:GAF domain-containing protein
MIFRHLAQHLREQDWAAIDRARRRTRQVA